MTDPEQRAPQAEGALSREPAPNDNIPGSKTSAVPYHQRKRHLVQSSRPAKLIYITASMPFGPGEEFLVAEANELARQGCELLIVPRSPNGAVLNGDAASLCSCTLRRPLIGPSILARAGLECLRHPVRVARALTLLFRGRGRKGAPDRGWAADSGWAHSRRVPPAAVFIKNLLVLPKSLWLAELARKWGAEHVHAHWARTTATMAMIVGELTGIPWSLTLHRDDVAHPNLLQAKLNKASFSRFISQSGLAIARDVGAECPVAKTRVIHMGVCIPPLPPERTVCRDTVRVLCVASLLPVKGHTYLIKAMGLLRERGCECELALAGEGLLRKSLEADVAELELEDRVRFLGQVPHEHLIDWYRDGNFDIVVLPSVDLGDHEHEGIPVSLMEAMAHGIPVISTQTGGIPELIGNGAGLLVPPQNPPALADALEALIRDSSLRAQLGAAGRRRIEERFSVARTAAELVACIQERSSASKDLGHSPQGPRGDRR